MARVAARLGRLARPAKPLSVHGRDLPTLWFLTDPARTPDPVAAILRLPAGAGVIYRAFGAPDALETALALRRLTIQCGLVLLIGADAELAARVGADGVHLPQRLMHRARPLRRAHPRWLITAAVHGVRALELASRSKLDAAIVSVVLPSRSASARSSMGPVRFAALMRLAKIRAIALGGVTAATAPRLIGSGAAGLAAVEGLA